MADDWTEVYPAAFAPPGDCEEVRSIYSIWTRRVKLTVVEVTVTVAEGEVTVVVVEAEPLLAPAAAAIKQSACFPQQPFLNYIASELIVPEQ
jgi:hypothetical protein